MGTLAMNFTNEISTVASSSKSNFYCTYCHRGGHTVDYSWAKHGLPVWWKTKHFRGNNNRTSTSSSDGISSAQWKQIRDLYALPHSTDHLCSASTTSWLLDSGASHHVTGNRDLLVHTRDITHCPIGLPDGKEVISIVQGEVQLCTNVVLHNVYYVPSLNCNLISVSQLIQDVRCIVTFTNTLCVIQAQHSRTLIALGEQRDGLYYFRGIPQIRALPTSGNTFDLWHQRLGHPSDKVVRSLSFFVKFTTTVNKACDVCHQAKHSRSPFPSSDSRATSRLEITL